MYIYCVSIRFDLYIAILKRVDNLERFLKLKRMAKDKRAMIAASRSNASINICNNSTHNEDCDSVDILRTSGRFTRSDFRKRSFSCSTLNRNVVRNFTEQQRRLDKESKHNDVKTSHCSVKVQDSAKPISKNMSNTGSNLFLMGGIVCDPVMPRRNSTGIPLLMHEAEYKRYKSSTSVLSRISTDYSMRSSNGQIMSSYERQKQEAFLQKEGHIFIVKTYQSEYESLRIMLSQYGNMQMSFMNNETKAKIYIQICLMSKNKCVAKSVKRLDFCNTLYNYKFNYIYKFQSGSIENVKDSYLHIKLKHKKYWYKRARTILARLVKLQDVQVDTEDYIETQLF